MKVGHSCRRKGSGRPGRGEFTPVDSGPTCGRPVRARSVRLTQGPPAMRPFCDGWSGQRCHRRLRHRHSSARDKQRRDRDCPCRCMRCFGCGTPLDRFTRFFQPDWIKAVYPPGSDWDAVAADIPAFVPGLRGQKDCSSEQNYQQAQTVPHRALGQSYKLTGICGFPCGQHSDGSSAEPAKRFCADQDICKMCSSPEVPSHRVGIARLRTWLGAPEGSVLFD